MMQRKRRPARCATALALAWLAGCEDEARLVFPAGAEQSGPALSPELPEPARPAAPAPSAPEPAPDDTPGPSGEAPVAPGPLPSEPALPAPPAAQPLYAVMFEVFDDVGSNSYLSLLESLDVPEIDVSQAREFPGGRAYVRVYDGAVFVGAPTAPEVTRYSVSADNQLVEEGTISFANFGLESGAIDDWGLTFVSPTKAYQYSFVDGTHIVWNPTTMEVLSEIPPPPEFVRPGYSLDSSTAVVRGNRMYRSLYWANWDLAEFSSDHVLAVYDLSTDRLIEAVPETRCAPLGNRAQIDEDGNLYFSNWIWPIAGVLMRGATSTCVLRVPAGSDRFDPNWTLSFSDLSDGHQGGMFTYLGGGKGLVSIFDETRIGIEPTTDPFDYSGSGNWSIWSVDLATRSGSPVEGIPLNAGAYTPALLDGRLFLLVPQAGWAVADLYEVRDGKGVQGMKIPGWSYAIEKVR